MFVFIYLLKKLPEAGCGQLVLWVGRWPLALETKVPLSSSDLLCFLLFFFFKYTISIFVMWVGGPAPL